MYIKSYAELRHQGMQRLITKICKTIKQMDTYFGDEVETFKELFKRKNHSKAAKPCE